MTCERIFFIENLDVDNLVLISETVDEIKSILLRWKTTFESNGVRVNLEKT